ncbi:HPP family-domain-containing protein [Gaertneriomyces semiglobifer]|nr:HPP family-domain-containing protein [Gaertneriomyces semiglobifer]
MAHKEKIRRAWAFYKDGVLARPSRGVLPAVPTFWTVFASTLAAFIGIGSVAAVHYHGPKFTEHNIPTVVASFGASAVLLYNTIESPLAQPRCVLGGQVISALVGVTVQKIIVRLADATDTELANWRWFGCALAVALSVAVMQLTRTTHPPGGATAFAAILGPDVVWDLGYLYVITPVALGSVMLLSVAIVVNNALGRKYPQYWISPQPLFQRQGSKPAVSHDDLVPVDDICLPPVEGTFNMVVDPVTGAAGLEPEVRSVQSQYATHQLERMVELGAAAGVGHGATEPLPRRSRDTTHSNVSRRM